jgi:hypothetical protein
LQITYKLGCKDKLTELKVIPQGIFMQAVGANPENYREQKEYHEFSIFLLAPHMKNHVDVQIGRLAAIGTLNDLWKYTQ